MHYLDRDNITKRFVVKDDLGNPIKELSSGNTLQALIAISPDWKEFKDVRVEHSLDLDYYFLDLETKDRIKMENDMYVRLGEDD